MTNELLTQIVRKNKMYVEWKTTPVTSADHEQIKLRFKNYEKEVRNAIQETKKRYFNRIFTAYKCDIKKTWLVINDTLSRNKNKCDLPATFNYNGLVLSDPIEIANSFNVYFASIGDKLASEIKTPTNKNINFTSYLKNPTKNRLKFTHITEEDTIKAIDNLENKNSSGHDGISNKLLKLIGHVLCKSLTLIINQMFTSGIFPDAFKTAKIIPIHKKGNSNDFSRASNILFSILFADDTTVIIEGQHYNNLILTLNTELNKLDVWLQANKLTLNTDKTHYMVFHRAKIKSETGKISIRNNAID